MQDRILRIPLSELLVATAAGLVWLVGFGALNLFWLIGDWNSELRGLWSFRAATLGDGLLLPLIVGSLVYIVRGSEGQRHDLFWFALGTALGSSLFLVQVMNWLYLDGQEPNWTMPEPGTLNSAGIYHAAAGCLMSGLIAGLSVLAVRRTRSKKGAIDSSVLNAWLLCAGCALAFSGCVAADGIEDRGILSSWTIFYFASAILGGLALTYALRSGPGYDRGFLLSPIIFGASIGLASWKPLSATELPLELVIGIGAAALALVFHFTSNKNTRWYLEVPAVAASSMIMPTTGLIAMPADLPQSVFFLVAAFVLIALSVLAHIQATGGTDEARGHRQRESIPYFFAQAYISYYLLLLVLVIWPQKVSDAVLLAALLVPLTIGQLRRVAWARYQAMIEDEHVLGDDIRSEVIEKRNRWPCSGLEQSYWDTWLSLLGFGTGIIILLIYSLGQQGILADVETAVGQAESPSFRDDLLLWIPLAAAAAGVALMLAMLLLQPRIQSRLTAKTLYLNLPVPSAVAAGVGLAAWGLAPWLASFVIEPPDLSRSWLNEAGGLHVATLLAALPVAHLMRRMTEDSIQYNLGRIEAARLAKRARWLKTIAGVVVGANCYWLLCVGIWHEHSVASLPTVASLTALVTSGCVLVMALLGLLLFRATPDIQVMPRQLSLHHPATNVAQDHILMFAMLNWVLVAAIYTGELLISYMPELKLALIPLFLASPFGVFFVIYVFLFKQTDATSQQHVWRERARISRALLVRAGDDLDEAISRNQRRAESIKKRFIEIQEFAGVLMIFFRPAIAISDRLARLLPEAPMDLEVRLAGEVQHQRLQQLASQARVYTFSVKGFESTPLDLALHVALTGGKSEPVRVKGLYRDRDAELLYIVMPPDALSGEYELLIDLTRPEDGGDPVAGLQLTHRFAHIALAAGP